MSNQYIGDEDLIYNTSSRLPVCLCLDVSGSMTNDIDELTRGVEALYKAIMNDDAAAVSAEIAIVTFGSDAKLIENFETADKKKRPYLTIDGSTNMTAGVMLALETLDKRKQDYKRNGIDYYQPWLIIMSDGEPNDLNSVKQVQSTVKDLESNKKLAVFAVGIGDYSDIDVLGGFSKRGAKKLKDYSFSAFFEWIGKSVSVVSNSRVGDTVQLDREGMSSWEDI